MRGSMKEFSLFDGQITVVVFPNKSGHIESSMKQAREEGESDRSWDEYGAAVDGLESLILAHACAGVDVGSEAYQAGIRDAYQAVAEKFCAYDSSFEVSHGD